MTKTER